VIFGVRCPDVAFTPLRWSSELPSVFLLYSTLGDFFFSFSAASFSQPSLLNACSTFQTPTFLPRRRGLFFFLRMRFCLPPPQRLTTLLSVRSESAAPVLLFSPSSPRNRLSRPPLFPTCSRKETPSLASYPRQMAIVVHPTCKTRVRDPSFLTLLVWKGLISFIVFCPLIHDTFVPSTAGTVFTT